LIARRLPSIPRLPRDHGWNTKGNGRRRRPGGNGKRVVLACLSGEHAFGLGAVPLALAVLLERVLAGDRLVHEELPVHRFECSVGRLEIGVGNEAIAL
jgi:hypothetical protein